MSARFLCISAVIWAAAACGISDNAVFGPEASPQAVAGAGVGAQGGAAGGSVAGGGVTSGGVSGAASGGRGGGASGGAVTQPTAGDGNPPDPGGAGESAGGTDGAGGDPSMPPQPVCGNGVIEAGEECDGGADESRGCSQQCRVVCTDYGEDVVESEDHHCYAGYDESEFNGAREDCTQRGAHLVTISSAAENELVAGLVNDTKFIGGFEDAPLMSPGNGDYRWVTGEPLSYTNWDDEEPDRAESRCGGGGPGPIGMRCYEHCLAIAGYGRWLDTRCDQADGYVCEWEPPGSR